MVIYKQYICEITFRVATNENILTYRNKLGTKGHILTDKNGIPLSAVIPSASTHTIQLVTFKVDSAVIKRPLSSTPPSRKKEVGGQGYKNYALTEPTIHHKKNMN